MSDYSIIGKPTPNVDGAAKTTGEAVYTFDMTLPNMLHGKLLRSPHAHAKIISIDTSEAEKLPVGDASVDYAFANMYLHHVGTPSLALAEMARIVKPGGKVVVTDMDAHDSAFLKEEHHDRWMGFKREDVERWLVEAGLQDVAVDCVGEECCAQSESGQGFASVSIFVVHGDRPAP